MGFRNFLCFKRTSTAIYFELFVMLDFFTILLPGWFAFVSCSTSRLVPVYSFEDDCRNRMESNDPSLISTCDYNKTRDYYLGMEGQSAQSWKNYKNSIGKNMDSDSQEHYMQFIFLYGEVTWRGRIFPKNGLEDGLVSRLDMVRPKLQSFRESIKLYCTLTLLLSQARIGSEHAHVFIAAVVAYKTKSASSDVSSKNSTSWQCPEHPCGILPTDDPEDGLHNYTLRWFHDQVIWFIDGVVAYNLTDSSMIPQEPLALRVYGINSTARDSFLDVIVQSVSVWQNPEDIDISVGLQLPSVQEIARLQGAVDGSPSSDYQELMQVFSYDNDCGKRDAHGRFLSTCSYVFVPTDKKNESAKDDHDTLISKYSGMVPMNRNSDAKRYEFEHGEVRWKAQPMPGYPDCSKLELKGPDMPQRASASYGHVASLYISTKPVDHYSKTIAAVSMMKSGLVDMSDDQPTSWECQSTVCRWFPVDLSSGLHNYTLKWTREELLWLIDGIPVYRLTDLSQIPQHPMKLWAFPEMALTQRGSMISAIRLPDDRSCFDMIVHSVSVWQNRSKLVKDEYVLLFYDTFDGYSLDVIHWKAVRGASSIREYNNQLVHVFNGSLLILTKMTDSIQTSFGRVDATPKSEIQYGEVEWLMKYYRLAGIQSQLKLHSFSCINANDTLDQACLSIPNPTIGFAFNEWGSVTSTLATGDAKTDGSPLQRNHMTVARKVNYTGFHLYRILWTQEHVVWYLDDREFDRVNASVARFFNKPMSVAMESGLAMEPGLDPDPSFKINQNRTKADQAMEIGHVRIYVRSEKGLRNWTWLILLTTGLAISAATLLLIARIIWKRRHVTAHLESGDSEDNADCQRMTELLQEYKLTAFLERYTHLLEVPRSSVDIQGNKILGHGSYGTVLRAVATDLQSAAKRLTVVAVKVFPKNDNMEAQKAFAHEVKGMIKAGMHRNVIQILGIVSKGRPFIILEYCENGSLLDYLRGHRPNAVYVQVTGEGALLPFIEEDMRRQWLQAGDGTNSRDERTSVIAKNMLCTGDLIQFSSQISRGMEYLGIRSIIHRDLAARNVLVSQKRVMKIADFGLARIAEPTYTMENTNVRLPHLWTCPDALNTKTFSRQSDAWSFGILLFEVFSLGDEPFNTPDAVKLPVSAFVKWLMQGNQMPRPTGSPFAIYQLMQQCWNLDANSRPTFSQLLHALDALFSMAAKIGSDIGYIGVNDEEEDTATGLELSGLQYMIGECLAYKDAAKGNIDGGRAASVLHSDDSSAEVHTASVTDCLIEVNMQRNEYQLLVNLD